MKFDRIQNSKRNIVAGTIYQTLMILFPFVNRRLFLMVLGEEYLGLNGLFSSLLGVLNLSELGFGTAIIYSLYKAIADDDKEKICASLTFFRRVYHLIGTTILVLGLCCMPFLRYIIKGHIPEDINLYALFAIHLVNASISYFFIAYKSCLLSAYQRQDIASKINSILMLLQYSSTLLVLYATRNYYLYTLVTTLFVILSNIITARAVKKLFPDYERRGELPKEDKKAIMTDVKSIFVHEFGGVIVSAIDNIVLSVFIGLVPIALYSSYHNIMVNVSSFLNMFHNSIRAGLGNSISTESIEDNYQRFMKLSFLNLLIVIWAFDCLFCMFQPFIKLWLGESMLLPLDSVLLVSLNFYVFYSRSALINMKNAAGIWNQDKYKPIISGLANLGLNCILVQYWGINGVIIPTILTCLLIEVPWETHVVFKYYFKRSSKDYFTMQLRFFLLSLPITIITWYAGSWIENDGFLNLLLRGLITAIVPILLFMAIFRSKLKIFTKYIVPKRFQKPQTPP